MCPKVEDWKSEKMEEAMRKLDGVSANSFSISKPHSAKSSETAWWNPITQTFNVKELPNEIKDLIR